MPVCSSSSSFSSRESRAISVSWLPEEELRRHDPHGLSAAHCPEGDAGLGADGGGIAALAGKRTRDDARTSVAGGTKPSKRRLPKCRLLVRETGDRLPQV